MAGFWESCLQRFEQELPAQQFNTWIRPLRLEGESAALESGLRLIAPNSFILKWVRDRYLSRIEDYSRAFFPGPVSISLVIGGGKAGSSAAAKTTSALDVVVEPTAKEDVPKKAASVDKARAKPSKIAPVGVLMRAARAWTRPCSPVGPRAT